MIEIISEYDWDIPFEIENGRIYLDGVDGDIESYACTEELHDILADFLNMGIENALCKPVEVYTSNTQLEENIMTELKSLSLATSRRDEIGDYTYTPTIIYGMVAPKLISAIVEEIKATSGNPVQ